MSALLKSFVSLTFLTLCIASVYGGSTVRRTFAHYEGSIIQRLDILKESDSEIEFIYVSSNINENTTDSVSGFAKAIRDQHDVPEFHAWPTAERFPVDQYGFQAAGCTLHIFLEAYRGPRAIVLNKGCKRLSGESSSILRQGESPALE